MRLTRTTRFSGCGAKLGPGVLEQALCGLEQPAWPGLIADFSHCEDAGLFAIDADRALVQTVDFFPPIVDDPHLFGRIAAANALSDIYAMGGTPLTALALVCFPVKTLGLDALRAAMGGGLGALTEAGCALLGGHSIDDPEPKLGYAVTGLVHPAKAWRNNTIAPGAALILTKAIGTGVVNMAVRKDAVSTEARHAAESSMARLNRGACEILRGHTVIACTDVTGFGLAGHAAEMVDGARCGITIDLSRVPLLPGAAEYASRGLVPGGTGRNRDGRMHAVRLLGPLPQPHLDLLFDPQTSGGLLAAVPRGEAEAVLRELVAAGESAAVIGETGGTEPVVKVTGEFRF